MKRAARHVRRQILRGLLAVIPLALTYFVLRLIYVAVDQRVARLIERWCGFRIPGLGLLLVLVLLYLAGLLTSHWLGRQAFGLLERVSGRLPLVKTVYSLGKQLAAALSFPGKQAFRRVVMVEQFREGVWSLAFVTGEVEDRRTGTTLLRLFVPTAPNPTTGFTILVPAGRVRDLPLSVPEAMNVIVSGGLVGPDEID